MAQSITTTAAGRVNRRFLLLALILATLAGVLSYAAFTSSGDGGGGGGGEATVVVARSAIPPGTELTSDMLETRSVAQTAVGEGAFTAIDDAVGQVVRYPVAANQQILLTTVVGGSDSVTGDAVSYIVEEGQRGMAVTVEEVINVGGLALPGDHVDVYWVPEEVIDEDVVGAVLIAEDVEVLAVSQTLVDLPPTAPGVADEGEATADTSTLPPGDERVRASEAEANSEAATVTLHLTPEQAARVFCADAGKGPIRLAVRAFGDDSPSGQQQGECVIPALQEAPQ